MRPMSYTTFQAPNAIAKFWRPYVTRSGQPGTRHDGYTYKGVWYKTLRDAKAARAAHV